MASDRMSQLAIRTPWHLSAPFNLNPCAVVAYLVFEYLGGRF